MICSAGGRVLFPGRIGLQNVLKLMAFICWLDTILIALLLRGTVFLSPSPLLVQSTGRRLR